VIGFAGEKRLGFELTNIALGGRQLAVEVFQEIVTLPGVGFFPSEGDVCLDVAGDGSELIVRGNLFFSTLAVAKNSLRFFLVVPEIGLSNADFERFQTVAILWRVKESSERAKCGA
jgi:hypothetical protein